MAAGIPVAASGAETLLACARDLGLLGTTPACSSREPVSASSARAPCTSTTGRTTCEGHASARTSRGCSGSVALFTPPGTELLRRRGRALATFHQMPAPMP